MEKENARAKEKENKEKGRRRIGGSPLGGECATARSASRTS